MLTNPGFISTCLVQSVALYFAQLGTILTSNKRTIESYIPAASSSDESMPQYRFTPYCEYARLEVDIFMFALGARMSNRSKATPLRTMITIIAGLIELSGFFSCLMLPQRLTYATPWAHCQNTWNANTDQDIITTPCRRYPVGISMTRSFADCNLSPIWLCEKARYQFLLRFNPHIAIDLCIISQATLGINYHSYI